MTGPFDVDPLGDEDADELDGFGIVDEEGDEEEDEPDEEDEDEDFELSDFEE